MVEKSKFVCSVCGYQSLKWMGRCPECGEWDCLLEEKKRTASSTLSSSSPQTIGEIVVHSGSRYSSKIDEFDRILGGGVVSGSVVLVGGEPGIGKSTLLMEVAEGISHAGFPILYVSGEESVQQTKMRADRLGVKSASLYILSENNLEVIQNHITKLQPKIIIVDSIQTIYLDSLNSSCGTVSQVRECTASFVRMAKKNGIATFLVGHVTKDGSIAGPRIMEHMVDTVLYFESSQDFQYRVLRAIKNRFGPTSEIGIFKMGDKGLVEVLDSSTLFITDSSARSATPGTAIVPAVKGSRVFLIEIQTLVDRSNLAIPRRVVQGVDYNRVYLLLAVLGRRGFNFYQKDVYVNVAGGIKVDEPACDLAILLSLASSIKNRPLKPKTVVVGEVGLTGEIRPVGFMGHRLSEAKKLGFRRCIGPLLEKTEAFNEGGIEFVAAKTIEEAIQAALEDK